MKLGSARADFTRASRPTGGGRDIRRGTGKFVKAVGGPHAASRMMAPSRGVATGIGRFLADVAQQGVAAALRPFNLESLSGAPAADVFAAVVDVLCPAGGTIDEAIARDAMLSTVAVLAADGGGLPLDQMPGAALESFFLGTIAKSIETKIFNELNTRGVRLPVDLAAVEAIASQLHGYVDGAVHDAFAGIGGQVAATPPDQVEALVADIYERAFEVLQILGDDA